jgi:RNA polymerase sigma-70 factor (ECF subfamily)
MSAQPEAIRRVGARRARREGPLTPRAERAAIRDALRGDRAALDVLSRAYWPAAYRAAWLVVRDPHAAEDIAQEGLLAAIAALDRFDRSRPFGPWLRTIVTRRAIDATRARAQRREVDGAMVSEHAAGDDPSTGLADDLLTAVAALPAEQRTVVVLRHLLELTPTEIAEAVGVPRGTVNSRLRRGLDTLAQILAVVLAGAVVVLSLTSPGRAAAQWVGHHLSEVTRRVLPDAPRPVTPVRTSAPLPGGGRVLSVAGDGLYGFGLGGTSAARKLLGSVDAAAWSPHGRFAVAARGIELIAVNLRGRRHWSLAAPRAIRWPSWSPSGFRVAYVAGTAATGGAGVWVVAGDGSGNHLLAATRSAPPAWQPGVAPAERLATIDAAARVVLRDADTGHVLWRSRVRLAHVARLAWTADGTRVLAATADRVVVFDGATGARIARHRPSAAASASVITALAVRPRQDGYAIVRRVRTGATFRSQVTVVRTDSGFRHVRSRSSILFAAGVIRAIAWSPRGDWLAADVGGVDGWELVHLAGGRIDRSRTLAAGRDARLAGWCCS